MPVCQASARFRSKCLCAPSVNLQRIQTALSKRDQQLLENTVGQADKEAKMMQAVADAKRCEPIINDLKAKLVETEATHEKAHT